MPLPYFAKFPTVLYDIEGNSNERVVTNIVHRAALRKVVQDNAFVYYDYLVKDGETPEQIAHKYYGDSKYHWVVLLSNDVQHPFFDWPLSYDDFNNTMKVQFQSIRDAKQTIFNYLDILGNVIDKTTYDGLAGNERQTISTYDYYFNLNESKRKIRLLDKQYLSRVDSEMTSILANVPK